MRSPNFMAALVTVIDADQFVRESQLFERFFARYGQESEPFSMHDV